MFRKVFPSIIRSLKLYIQHHTIQVLWQLASKQPQNLYDIYLILPAGVMDELERSFNSSMTPAGSDIGEYYQML
jgi:hypothetical protein